MYMSHRKLDDDLFLNAYFVSKHVRDILLVYEKSDAHIIIELFENLTMQNINHDEIAIFRSEKIFEQIEYCPYGKYVIVAKMCDGNSIPLFSFADIYSANLSLSSMRRIIRAEGTLDVVKYIENIHIETIDE